MKNSSKIYIAGHQGLVGSALVRTLQHNGYVTLITKTMEELDLRNQAAVHSFFAKEQPEYVFLAAAKVGGIKANNDYPAEFIYDNIMINTNVIHAAYTFKVTKLLFLGSSCIYPKLSPQPIKEEYLLTGPLEKTNEPYALAKIAGINLCSSYNKQYGTNFIACMPTNIYGPYDNFNFETSHVVPALIAKIHKAALENEPTCTIWGTGSPRREFLFVDDLAQALLFLMNDYTGNNIINVGTGIDISIYELALMIKQALNYYGAIIFDTTKPDGTPQKLLDISALTKLGWQASTSLQEGINRTIKWYLDHYYSRPLPHVGKFTYAER